MSLEHDLWLFCSELTEILDFWSFTACSSNKPKNGQMNWEHDCDTCLLNYLRYEIFEVYVHNVVTSRKNGHLG